MTSPLVDVHLRRVPVALWARTQEHTDELLREFALIASDPGAASTAPARLTQLVETVTQAYAGVGSEQEAQLFAAAAAGVPEIDLHFQVPPDVSEACTALNDMLDEADDYCRAGEHLLTLTTPSDMVRFRRWYLDEFVTQVAGAAPVPWPEHAAA